MATGYEPEFIEKRLPADDGLSLYIRIYGAECAGNPVICLPGLSRNSRDFHQLALFLSDAQGSARRVICIDFRGRGSSGRDPDSTHYNIVTEATDVIAVCRALDIDRADFIGTSRGGLVMHLLAAMAPDLLGKLVLNDIGPEVAVEGLRQIQAYLGRQRSPENWNDAVALLKQAHASSFPALSETDWSDMAYAIYRETDGFILADFDPAISEQLQAADLSKPLPDLWQQFAHFKDHPLLVIRGEHSRLLTIETVERMDREHPRLQTITASGQGHAPILHIGGIAPRIADFLVES